MAKLNKKDFIEIEFTARVKDGEFFDSNIPEDLKKVANNSEINPSQAKPFTFCLGEGMFLKGVEDFLIEKSSKDSENYEIELSPEKAFGNRDSKLVKIIPIKIFHQQKINPVSGAIFNFDGRAAKILSVSGGRVITDFNHPLAGKNVVYDIKILRKIEDLNEKVKSFIEFLFRQNLKFEINKKDKKIILEANSEIAKFAEMFKEKFKEIFNLNLEIKEIKEKPKKEKEISDSK